VVVPAGPVNSQPFMILVISRMAQPSFLFAVIIVTNSEKCRNGFCIIGHLRGINGFCLTKK